MYRVVRKAFTVEAETLTQAVDKWARSKHTFHSYEDTEIQRIESTQLLTALTERLIANARGLLPIDERGKERGFLSVIEPQTERSVGDTQDRC